MSVKNELGWILEAAEARCDQWQGVADGRAIQDLTDELYEADKDEAEGIARGLREALQTVGAANLIDEDNALTAMCIWEAVLEIQHGWNKHATENEPVHEWIAEREGAYSARMGCLAVAPFFNAVWQRANARHWEGAFDWEMVPWILDYIVEHYESPTEVAELPDSAAQRVANEFLAITGD